MEPQTQSLFTWFDPKEIGEDDEEENIPQVRVDGWIICRPWPGKEPQILKVKTVRLLHRLKFEILYPPSLKGEEIYDDGFSLGRMQRIPEEKALAVLARQGLPLPGSGEEDGESKEEA